MRAPGEEAVHVLATLLYGTQVGEEHAVAEEVVLILVVVVVARAILPAIRDTAIRCCLR